MKKRTKALQDLSSLNTPELSETMERLLRPYQRTGVAWLMHLFRNQLGGILADEGPGENSASTRFLSGVKREMSSVLPSRSMPRFIAENWQGNKSVLSRIQGTCSPWQHKNIGTHESHCI